MAKKKKVRTRKQKILHRILVVLIVLAAGICAFLLWWRFGKKDAVTDDFAAGPVYDSAVVTSIEETYAATGRIASGKETGAGEAAAAAASGSASAGSTQAAGTSSLSAGDASGYPVKEIYVKVGDTVKKGDPLYSLDMSDLEDQIALNQKKLALQAKSDAIDDAAATRALEQAQAASAQQYNDATRKLNEAASDANSSIVDSVTGNQELARLNQELSDAQAAYDSAKAAYDALEAQQSQITNQYNALSGEIALETAQLDVQYGTDDSKLTDEYKSAAKAIEEKQVTLQEYANQKTAIDTQVEEARTKLDDAQTKRDTAKSDLDTATSSLTSTDSSIQTQQRALEDQASSVASENRSTAEAEAAARDAIAKNAISQESAALDTQSEIQKAQEKLNGAVIKASMDGTVTQVNAQPGQLPGTDAVVLNDLETMKVVIEVEEGHIADIQVGQRVNIKTDSTGNDVLSGKVTYAAITPTEAAAPASGSGTQSSGTSVSTGTKATYRVEVTLDSPNDRLRIGMTASVTFILASAKDTIAVPTAAIQTDDAGNSYVNVADMTGGAGSSAYVEDSSATEGMTEDAGMDTAGAQRLPLKERLAAFLDRITGKQAAEEAAEPIVYPATQVPVTTGIADDYYTQITSGDIREGDMVEEPGSGTGGASSDLLEGLYAGG